jgi:hypothetical protein
VLAAVAMFGPSALSIQRVGFVGILLTGLAHHAAALVAGHGSSLAVLVARGTLSGDPPRRR